MNNTKKIQNSNNTKNIFIGGYSRTGTTLIQGIICTDENTIPVTAECWYLHSLVLAYQQNINNPHTKDYFENTIKLQEFHKKIIDLYFNHIQKKWGENKYIVQKAPVMTTLFSEINDLIPNSLFIVMLRDPRDAISSQIERLRKRPLNRINKNISDYLNDYVDRYTKLIQFKHLFSDNLLFIKYEDLILNQKSIIQRLRKFTSLKLEVNPTEQEWEYKRPETGDGHTSLDGKPLSSQSIGNYKKILNIEQLQYIESKKEDLNKLFGLNIFWDEDKNSVSANQRFFITNTITKTQLNSNQNTENWQLTTPVVFVIFNRPDTTAKVFEAIRQAKPPKLLVIADGARIDKPGEAKKCAAARAIINQVDWQCEVLTNYSDVNLGCRKRVSSGLDWVFEQVEEAIILEDDCLPHPTFFRYCQELLEKYRDDEHIMMISGNNFQFGRKRNEYSYYFSHYSHIWG